MERRVVLYRAYPGTGPATRAGVAPHASHRHGGKTSTTPCARKKELGAQPYEHANAHTPGRARAQTRGQTDSDKRVVVYVSRAKIDEGAREACKKSMQAAYVANQVAKESVLTRPGEGGGFVMAGPMTRVVSKLTDLVDEAMRSLKLEMKQAALRHEKGTTTKKKKSRPPSAKKAVAVLDGDGGRHEVEVDQENAGNGMSSVWVHYGSGTNRKVRRMLIPASLLTQLHTNVMAATAETPERWFTLSC